MARKTQTKTQTKSQSRVLSDVSADAEPAKAETGSTQNVRELGKDEKPRVDNIVQDNSTVVAHFGVGGDRTKRATHQCVSTFDFSDCTPEDILKLAIRPCVIATQRRYKAMSPEAQKSGSFETVNVKHDILETARKPADPLSKASRTLEQMSPEERKVFLEAELAKMSDAAE